MRAAVDHKIFIPAGRFPAGVRICCVFSDANRWPASEKNPHETVENPLIRRVQFHEMLTPETYRKHRWDFMRLHYQFVMANERRVVYDYFFALCGPLPLERMARAARGPVDAIAPDGSLIAPPEAAESVRR